MDVRDKTLTAMVAVALHCTAAPHAANAQGLERFYEEPNPLTIVEEDRSNVRIIPRVIERHVLIQTTPALKVEAETIAPKRSNYRKRLVDMLEQLSLAYERGWLTCNQYNDLKKWEASVAMEELILRQNGNGIIPLADVEQLERHLNGLAYTINRQISGRPTVARAGGDNL